jgi:hypothetical protein
MWIFRKLQECMTHANCRFLRNRDVKAQPMDHPDRQFLDFFFGPSQDILLHQWDIIPKNCPGSPRLLGVPLTFDDSSPPSSINSDFVS